MENLNFKCINTDLFPAPGKSSFEVGMFCVPKREAIIISGPVVLLLAEKEDKKAAQIACVNHLNCMNHLLKSNGRKPKLLYSLRKQIIKSGVLRLS